MPKKHWGLKMAISLVFGLVGAYFGAGEGGLSKTVSLLAVIGLVSGLVVGYCYVLACLSTPRSFHILIRITLGAFYGAAAGAVAGAFTAVPIMLIHDCYHGPLRELAFTPSWLAYLGALLGTFPGTALGFFGSIVIAYVRRNEREY